MGLKDVSLDETLHQDCLLLITASEQVAEPYLRGFATRPLRVESAHSIDHARSAVQEQRIDVVLLIWDTLFSVEQVAAFFAEASLYSAQKIVIGDAEALAKFIGLRGLEMLPPDSRVVDVILKVALVTRLKRAADQSGRFEDQLVAQNVKLRDLTTRFTQELKEAVAIQQSILPRALPRSEFAKFASAYVPVEAVGGDCYDLFAIDEERVAVFIGDVTGHGLPAAFLGSMTKMSTYYAPKTSAKSMIEEMNRGLAKVMPEGRFVTGIVAIYNTKTGVLQLSRAGHPEPYLLRAASRTLEIINTPGLPLGVLDDMEYAQFETTLMPGDKLLLVTDGLTETQNMRGDLLGVKGVGELFLKAPAEASIAKVLEHVLQEHEVFAEGRVVKDDITLVGLERTKA